MIARRVAPLAALVTMGALLAPAAEAAPVPVAGSGATFADSIGVNVHVFYPDTAYKDKARLKTLLLDLGVKHVRDGLRTGREPYGDEYPGARDIAAAGIKFQWVAGEPGSDVEHADTAMALVTDPNRLGGTADGFEGPNEFDRTRNNDLLWAEKLYAFMSEFHTRFKNDSRFSSMPFWGPSFMSDAGRDAYASRPGSGNFMDAPNAHPYPGGRQPELAIGPQMTTYATKFGDPNRKPVISETGFHTAIHNGNSGHFGVSERAQSIYILRTLLTAFANGAPRTYLYQFLDQKPEPALKDMEEHFGLVAVEGDRTQPQSTWTLRKKPAFNSVKELLEITRDTGTDARPASLDYSLSGAPSTLRSVLLSRSAGTVDLVLWNQVPVYNEPIWDCNHPDIPATITDPHQRCEWAKYNRAVDQGDAFPSDVPVTLNLAEPADVSTERPHSETSFTARGRGTSFALSVGADPIVVRIKGSRYATEVRNDAPSAWLRLAESSGTAKDAAGRGATVDPWVAAPTYGGASAVGDPEDRSVTVAPDQRATVRLAAPVSTNAGSTVELWVKPATTAPDWAHFLTSGLGDWTMSMRTYNFHDGSRWGSTYGSKFGSEMVFRGFDHGAWHHLVLTTANGVSTTYLDGRKVGEASGGESFDMAAFTLGARSGTGGFSGSLDELAVYPKALSAARVCAHYRAAGGSC
ncbi:MAG: LamG domain-containing protein [Actinomycetota bacterium]|nr:LamG domain-containing protein [Actinomycetota bacterium]